MSEKWASDTDTLADLGLRSDLGWDENCAVPMPSRDRE